VIEGFELWGKYRATVINNVDPLNTGRIQVMVPDVSNYIPSSWAMPCFPYAGKQTGYFSVPQIGDGVWIEFEQGDPDYPIWCGGFWGVAAEVPAVALISPPPIPHVVISTLLSTLQISDAPGPTGGISLTHKTSVGSIMINDTGITITSRGAMIMISAAGILISNGKGALINLAGAVTDVNGGGLTVK
jgi:type VI secretion system (T6SS) baseplate-like injector VgrG